MLWVWTERVFQFGGELALILLGASTVIGAFIVIVITGRRRVAWGDPIAFQSLDQPEQMRAL